jgi:hypothetical protein
MSDANARTSKEHEQVRRRLLIALERLASASAVVFVAGLAAAWVIRPLPSWVMPVMVASFGVCFGAILLYHVASSSFTEPTKHVHWELETPTSVRNLVRQNWVGPLFVWIVSSVVAIAGVRDSLHLSIAIAVVGGLLIGSTVTWVLVLLHARGWIRDE